MSHPPQGSYPDNQSENGRPGPSKTKAKTRLLTAIAVVGVLVVGVAIALIVVLTTKDDPQTATGASSSAPSSGAPTSGTGNDPGGPGASNRPAPGGQTNPQALGDRIIQAYRENRFDLFTSVVCPAADSSSPAPQNFPPELNAKIDQPATNAGIRIQLSTAEGPTFKVFRFKNQGGSLCVFDVISSTVASS